jgi:hypothetical protein
VKVWGSRNPLNVIKVTFWMLQSGNAPLAMGNGMGGEGRKLDKGSGIQGKDSVERERGRKMLDLKNKINTPRSDTSCYEGVTEFRKRFPGEKSDQFFRVRVVKRPPNLPRRVHDVERPLVSP